METKTQETERKLHEFRSKKFDNCHTILLCQEKLPLRNDGEKCLTCKDAVTCYKLRDIVGCL